ncbi:MAG: ArsR family transcriptional regulator [Chloroflexota bacterium]|nr:ArsR family transcriptional regulator [Chloroflexota bacterium]
MPGTDQQREPGADGRGVDGRFVDGRLQDAASANGHHPWPALRHEIVVLLRQVGPSSPDQLAARLGASRTGILQQLRALETAELVMRRTERHGVGRPRHLYDVTAQAQDLFPSNYDGLAAGLLAAIEAVGGGDLMDEIFVARRRQSVSRIKARLAERLPAGAPLADRVRELAVIQDEQGYLAQAEIRPDGTIRLVEHNCAILDVARGTARACDAELALFGEVLDADVVRESHIATGDRCCTYRVVARAD